MRRLGRRRLEATLDVELTTLTNVRLRVTWPDGRGSRDVYGKVIGTEGGITRIHLTSVDAADEGILAALASPAPARADGVSNGAEGRR